MASLISDKASLGGRLLRFLLFTNEPHRNFGPQTYITVLAMHTLTLVTLIAMPLNLIANYQEGNFGEFYRNLLFVILIFIGELLFFRLRTIAVSKISMSVAVCFLFVGEALSVGSNRGLGLLYFVAGFSMLYFILGYRPGLIFCGIFIVAVNLIGIFGTFGPQSVFADPELRSRIVLILSVGAALGAASSYFLEYIFRHLSKIAYIDHVTGLGNRSSLIENLEQRTSVTALRRQELGIIAIKIQHFEQINTSLGTIGADAILSECARRLEGVVPNRSTAGRFSGTIFLVLCPFKAPNLLEEYAYKQMQALTAALTHQGNEIILTVDIAISRFPEDGSDSQKLLSSVLTTLSQPHPVNHIQFFDALRFQAEQEKAALSRDLHHAIERNELHLVYHPKIDFAAGTCSGAEILLRWTHGKQGSISPVVFIPLAEAGGMIETITRWVISQAIKEICLIKAQIPALYPSLIHALNLSPLDLASQSLERYITGLVKDADLRSDLIELEITEGVLMDSSHTTKALLADFSAGGYRLAIDDFGTGYSSLSYLHRLQVNTLKIDQSFIRRLDAVDTSEPIVAAIISMAKALSLDLTAEGVETAEQAQWLREHGCTDGQGWLWSKPMPLAQYMTWLQKGAIS